MEITPIAMIENMTAMPLLFMNGNNSIDIERMCIEQIIRDTGIYAVVLIMLLALIMCFIVFFCKRGNANKTIVLKFFILFVVAICTIYATTIIYRCHTNNSDIVTKF